MRRARAGRSRSSASSRRRNRSDRPLACRRHPGRRPCATRPRAAAPRVGPSRARAAQHLAAVPAGKRVARDRQVRSRLLLHHRVRGSPPGPALEAQVRHSLLHGLPGPLGERLLPSQPRRRSPGRPPQVLLADRFHRIAERMVAPACSGFLSVSRDYLDDLVRRYGETCAAARGSFAHSRPSQQRWKGSETTVRPTP